MKANTPPSEKVPELVVPPKAPSSAKAAAPSPSSSQPQLGGTAMKFDEDDVFSDPSEPIALDLDLSKGPPIALAPSVAMRATGSPRPVENPANGGDGARRTLASASDLARRSAVDPFEARALADYGNAPSEWYRTPFYAYRVKRREPELKRALEAKREETEQAEVVAEDALIGFAENVRSLAEKNAQYAPLLREVTQAEELFLARDTALAGETAAHKQRLAQLDAVIASLELELAATQAEEKVIAGELAEAEALLKRAEAKAKRTEIDIRNAMAKLDPKKTIIQ